jgi:hypothetical protein
MSETPPPIPAPEQKPSEWRSPQVILPIIATISTVVVALIGALPSLIEAGKPAATPTPIVVVLATNAPLEATLVATTAVPTEVPPSSTPLPESTKVAEVLSVPTNTPEPTQAPTNTPLPEPTQIPTNTPEPTQAPTDVPVPATPPNITLFYDHDSFTIMNVSGARASLEGVVFRSSAATWDISPFGGLMKSLPNNKCLRMRDALVGNRTPPAACGSQMYGFLEIGPKVIFWRDVDQFEVLRNDSLLATCTVAEGTCQIYVEQ